MRRALALLLLLLAPVLVACGGDDEQAPVGDKPDLPTEQPALWNPCDGLTLARVRTLLGVDVSLQAGTKTQPTCRFVPAEKGDPVVEVSYQLFPGSLDELFATFGQTGTGADTDVTTVSVPRADDARLVVDVDDDGTLLVSGFVQNGSLVQLVNAADTRPYQRDRLVRAVRQLLGDLSAHARAAHVDADD